MVPDAKGRSGFTLIELLVVIAIVAILAAILFPVFAQAREKARQAGCMSNVKQWAQAAMMYLGDYDERLPGLHLADPTAPQKMRSWPMLLEPYVKSGKVETGADRLEDCPTTRPPNVKVIGTINLPFFRSYGWNFLYLGVPDWGVPNPTIAEVKSPAETVMFCDTYAGLPAPNQLAGYYGAYAPSYFGAKPWPAGKTIDNWWELNYVKGGEYYGRITQRHNGGAIVAWVDGHVGWKKLPGPITQDNSLWDRE
jgi:prepilin-type N-terminal cleavage/methylation domain-containing protein/prepilin-type processing-associated H-X9-DG protein